MGDGYPYHEKYDSYKAHFAHQRMLMQREGKRGPPYDGYMSKVEWSALVVLICGFLGSLIVIGLMLTRGCRT